MNKLNPRHAVALHDILVLRSGHPDVRRLKQRVKTSAHGNKVWPSALVLMDYLMANPIPNNARILDVGAGWGVTSCFLAKHFKADVVALDIDPAVVDFVELQAKVNNVKIDTITMPYEALTAQDLAQFDLVIGADICFWDHQADDLVTFVDTCIEADVSRLILSDPGRPPFYDACERIQDTLDFGFYPWYIESNSHKGYILDTE